jgi:hypothetical protein
LTADGKPLSVDEGISDLDEPAAAFLFQEILTLSLPPQDVEKVKEQEGKD